MAIRRIEVSNFKSFDHLTLDLGNFNVLVGANASGKSNVLQIFRFLRDIGVYGLKNAIQMQGGEQYLCNISIGPNQGFALSVLSEGDYRLPLFRKKDKKMLGIRARAGSYEFSLRFGEGETGLSIEHDKASFDSESVDLAFDGEQIKELGSHGTGVIGYEVKGRRVTLGSQISPDLRVTEEELFPLYLRDYDLPEGQLMVESSLVFFLDKLRQDAFRDISILDIDPKIPKRATPVAGKSDLEEDGSNLAIVLQRILEDKEKKRAFTNLFTALLPFVEDIRVDRFGAKSLLLALQETYAHDNFIPASLLSDGTVVVAAIVAALYFEEKGVLLFEEPAAFLHPSLMSGLMEMFKEVSSKRQIIITTHNPEILRYVDINDILLVQRGKDGFSQITRPGEREDVKIFLENEMGINEMFAQNLLEV